METFILWLVILASIAYVAVPYFRRQLAAHSPARLSSSRFADLYERRDNILSAIKDLEFDYEMGKISDEDFEQMNQDYRQQAISVLKSIEGINGQEPTRKRLEAELKTLRRGGQTRQTNFCSACGGQIQPQDKFCSSCGQKLRE